MLPICRKKNVLSHQVEEKDEETLLRVRNTLLPLTTNYHKPTYNVINKYLKDNHFNVDKINDRKPPKDCKKKKITINNFVELRNDFVHNLGSKEALDYIENSDVLFFLKLAITILLLKKMGIEDIKFDKHYHKISVFDNSIEECDAISELLKKAESTSFERTDMNDI